MWKIEEHLGACSILFAVLAVSPFTIECRGEGQQPVQAPEKLALVEAEGLAFSANPVLKASDYANEIAESRFKEAKTQRLPSLQFRETFTNSNNPIFVFGSLLEQNAFRAGNFAVGSLNNPGSLSNFRSSLHLKLPVFDRFRIASGITEAELNKRQVDLGSEALRQEIRFQLVQVYFGQQVALGMKRVTDEAVTSAEAEARRIQDLFEQGIVVASDLLAMEVQLADFRQQQIAAEGDIATATANLNTLLSQPLEKQWETVDRLEQRDFPVPSVNELTRSAAGSHPDLLRAAKAVESARNKVRQQKGDYWPDLSLFAEYGNSNRDFIGGSADFTVGAALIFDIVDFGRSRRIEQAVAAVEKARQEEKHLKNRVELEIFSAHRNLTTSQRRLQVTTKAVDQANETLRIVRDRHRAGLTTITEVLRAQTALVRAEVMLLKSRYDTYVGYARLQLAAGMLNDLARF